MIRLKIPSKQYAFMHKIAIDNISKSQWFLKIIKNLIVSLFLVDAQMKMTAILEEKKNNNKNNIYYRKLILILISKQMIIILWLKNQLLQPYQKLISKFLETQNSIRQLVLIITLINRVIIGHLLMR